MTLQACEGDALLSRQGVTDAVYYGVDFVTVRHGLRKGYGVVIGKGDHRIVGRDALNSLIDHYHVHDSRDLGSLLPQKKLIDVTITSPPYWNLKDYDRKKQIGFGQSYDQFLDDLGKVFSAVYQTTKDTGSLWLVVDTLKHRKEMKLLPFDLADRLQEMGWKLRDVIIWQKDRTLPWSHQGKLRNSFEYVVFFSKTDRFKYRVKQIRDISGIKDYWVKYPERYSPEGKTPARTWDFPIPRQGSWGRANNYVRHACPLPPALIDRILRLTTDTGDLVLDPFAGSGSVLAEAAIMGRRYLGVDLNASYRQMFKKTVLPAAVTRRKSESSDIADIEKQQKDFAKTVMSLRRLKFPKELVRLYQNAHGELGSTLILAISTNSPNKLKVVLVFPSKTSIPKQLRQRIDFLIGKAPLTKYGLQPDVVAATRAQVASNSIPGVSLNLSRKLYQYENGHFYGYSHTRTVRRVAEGCQNGEYHNCDRMRYPPIVSTIGVNIDERHPLTRGTS